LKDYSFSTTGIPSIPINRRIVDAVTAQSESLLALSSGVSALFTEQFS